MKNFLLIIILLVFYGCNKPKTVLICGDHVCINKKEAKQYFEENLTLEVKILNDKIKEDTDLVQLNLNQSSERRNISIKKKEKTSKKLKNLTKEEVKTIKSNLKKKEKEKRITKKVLKNDSINQSKIESTNNKNESKKTKNSQKNKKQDIFSETSDIVDVCKIIEKCSIEEISKYLIKKGKNKSYPNLTIREKKL